MPDPTAWYDAHADELSDRYEAVPPERVHGWLKDLLPAAPATVLDVGTGSGRDAEWFSRKGYDVVAVEPSSRFRTIARERRDDPSIQWLADSLPGLRRTFRTGLAFDFILASAVWMHVAPSDRARAFRKLITLLKPGGALAITLRSGPAEPARRFHPVSADEVRVLARDHGAFVEREVDADDYLGRENVRWTQLAIRLPDDGTGALPLLRHVILNDDKSSTYKLGLLRVLCRIADGAGGLVAQVDDECVAIPMGLVALTWLRLYKPLLGADLPQSPANTRGGERLGFAKTAYDRLDAVSHHDLRVGMVLTGEAGTALHRALKDAARTIVHMPVRYMTYPNEKRSILPVQSGVGAMHSTAMVRLDDSYLASFGTMRVPTHLWAAVQRFTAWIEPAIQAEWMRVTRSYAERQGRSIDNSQLTSAMAWEDPRRDVRAARERAAHLLSARQLHCVWSGKRLSAASLDIDHCFPWTIWPCGDLWNLMPAHRKVNQHEKRDRLPTDRLLRVAQDRILAWWHDAYRENPNRVVAERFALEAAASLPGIVPTDPDLDSYYSAVNLQRLRLKQNQQAPEWNGGRYL
ncbi:MAG: methyltransferase domain-containing protein [Acidobacteria bacterium]|nr:methyltransferase domain-containing protein [Acidobacteriota bacterium]